MAVDCLLPLWIMCLFRQDTPPQIDDGGANAWRYVSCQRRASALGKGQQGDLADMLFLLKILLRLDDLIQRISGRQQRL